MEIFAGKFKLFFKRGHPVVFGMKNKIKYMYIVMFDWIHTYFILLLKLKPLKRNLEFLTSVEVKTVIFCVVKLYTLVGGYRSLGGTFCCKVRI
jgi:hypothetical protein